MRLLDLFCGAGGAGEGYRQAGFEVVGVDIAPQPNNPHPFVQADALEYLVKHGHEFDVIHASPPCQRYSQASPSHKRESYPDLLMPTIEALEATGKPYVVENVTGAKRFMPNPFFLCGTMFGLKVYRHRWFASNVLIFTPPHERHPDVILRGGQGKSPNGYITVTGNFHGNGVGLAYAREAMGIDWMNSKEITQAIPPAYTRYIGLQLINMSN